MWVLQEALSNVNNTMVCSGLHIASFKHFQVMNILLELVGMRDRARLLAAENWGQNISLTLERGQALSKIFGRVRLKFRANSTVELLLSSHGRQCADARDQIFSIYSVVHMGELHGIRPDYSLSTHQVYRLFIIGCLKHPPVHRTAYVMCSEFLALVGTESTILDDNSWPSWIPRFHCLTERSTKKYGLHRYTGTRGLPGWRKSLPRAPHLDQWSVIEEEKNVISVRGDIFAEVVKILPNSAWPKVRSLSFEREKANYLSVLDWYRHCRAFVKDLLDDFSEEVLKDLLTCTIDVEKKDYLHVNEAVLLSNDISAMEQGEEPEILEAMRWLLPFSLAVEDTRLDTDRYLCHLRVGGNFDVGWVPKSAREGDRLCMFGGASYPFVLRERENGRFRLLGDAFMLKTTLRQALRGNFTEDQVMESDYVCVIEDPDNDWNAQDEEMQRLISGLQWIALR